MHNEKTLKDLSLAEELIHKAELCLESNFELANERYSIAHKIIYNKEDTLNKTYGSSQIQSMKNDIDLISDGTYLEYKMSDFVLEDISREGFLDNVTSILKNTKDKIIEFIKRIINYIKNLFRSEKTKSKEVKLKKANKEEINNVVINIKSANINKVPDISKHPVNRVNEDNYIPENKTKTNIIQEISKTQSPEIFLINLIKLIKVNSLFNIISTVDLTKEDRDHIKLHSEWDDDYKKNLNNIPKSLEEFLKNLKNKCNLTDAVSEIKEAIKQKIIIPEHGIKSIKVISSFVNQIYDVINSEVNKNELEKLQNEITEKQIENIKDILVYGLKDINKISDDVSNLIYDTIQLVNKEFKDEDGFAEQSNAFLNVLFAFTKMNGLAFSKFDILTRVYVDLLELNINIDKDILEKEMFEANMKMFEHDYELVCEAFNLEDNIRKDLENLNENNKEEINARYYVYNHKINGNMTCERLTTEQLKVSLEGFMDTLKTVGSKIVEVIKKLIEYIIKGVKYLFSKINSLFGKNLVIGQNVNEITAFINSSISREDYAEIGKRNTVTKSISVLTNKDIKEFLKYYKSYIKTYIRAYIDATFFIYLDKTEDEKLYNNSVNFSTGSNATTFSDKNINNKILLGEIFKKYFNTDISTLDFTKTNNLLLIYKSINSYISKQNSPIDFKTSINNILTIVNSDNDTTDVNNDKKKIILSYSQSYDQFIDGIKYNDRIKFKGVREAKKKVIHIEDTEINELWNMSVDTLTIKHEESLNYLVKMIDVVYLKNSFKENNDNIEYMDNYRFILRLLNSIEASLNSASNSLKIANDHYDNINKSMKAITFSNKKEVNIKG